MMTIIPTLNTQVIICGAGPTGLSLACQLIRYGIDFIIIDKATGITPYSKAIGVHARTLELYNQINLATPALEQGSIAKKARIMTQGKVRGELDFSNMGKDLSPFPYILMLEQHKNEQLLEDYLTLHKKKVFWQSQLSSFSQNTDGVTAQVTHADGTSQTIHAHYLVGCDGPKSVVRHQLGLAFDGSTFERTFYVADTRIHWKQPHDGLTVCFTKSSFVLFFPLPGENRYRIVGVFPDEFKKDEGDVLYEEIEQQVKQEIQQPLDIYEVSWFSTYKVHSRHVSQFSLGRVFLAGDAAHIHTPVGAQGMNTGIQDSYNLAWKLAWVLHRRAKPQLLNSYHAERLRNAKNLLKTTDQLFNVAAGKAPIFSFFRLHILPYAPKFILNIDAVRKRLFPTISQIALHYRPSTLSYHHADRHFKVKAGDRMPYFKVNGMNIYDNLKQPMFHWLMFSNCTNQQAEWREHIMQEHQHIVDAHCFILTPEIEQIFCTDQPFALLLRPDNYIGLISLDLSFEPVERYLRSL